MKRSPRCNSLTVVHVITKVGVVDRYRLVASVEEENVIFERVNRDT